MWRDQKRYGALLEEGMMSAKIVVVTNQKGGSGKTTLSVQLAGTLGRRGCRVHIIDADAQGSSTRWVAAASDEKPFPATICGLSNAGEKVHREIKKYVESFDYIIVDCPPAVDSVVPQSALFVADLALVPIIPSPPDLWAGVGIRGLIHRIADSNENLKSRLVINMCQPNTRLAQNIMGLLDEFGIDPLVSRLGHRTAYRESAVFGSTVHGVEGAPAQAIQEIESLTDEVLALLN